MAAAGTIAAARAGLVSALAEKLARTPVPARRRAHRHWRDRFDPSPAAVYVWAKRLLVREKWVAAGDVVDRSIILTHKLRFMWRAGIVNQKPKPPVTGKVA